MFFISILVKFDEVLYLVFGHGFGDESYIDFLAFLEHPLGAGRSTSVHIDLDVLVILDDLVHRDHETSKEECWIVQVNEDELIRLLLLDGPAD